MHTQQPNQFNPPRFFDNLHGQGGGRRNPKAEIRDPKEDRNPNTELAAPQVSGGSPSLRISVFGFRI